MLKANEKILVIDDEPDMARAVRLALQLQEPGWEVVEAHGGEEGLLLADAEQPDLILLDISMPDLSGFEVLKQIRLFSDVPVIILTVRDDELDKVQGLELGADDYVVKPFSPLELMARIHSVLRRVKGNAPAVAKPYVSGPLRIDFATRRVTVDGKAVSLTNTEFHLLELLARNAGRIVTDETLLSRVWGDYAQDNPDYLKVYIYRLRRKLGDDPKQPAFIHRERGVGYWLAPPEKG